MATIGGVADAAQAILDAAWEANPDKPAGVLGAVEILCDDRSRVVVKGDVVACHGSPRTEADFALDPVGIVFLILDDRGGASFTMGTDLPHTAEALWSVHEEAEHGLFCRDLDDEGRAGFFSTCCGTPAGDYFRAVLYWCMEGMPDRMDADGDGVPCETLFDEATVDAVWNGGPLG